MIHLSSTLLLVGFLGGESSFELFDDVGVHVLVDLDGQEEDDEAGDDAGERQVVGAGLERADVRGGHVGGGGVTDHSGGDDHEAHDAVGQGASDLESSMSVRTLDSLTVSVDGTAMLYVALGLLAVMLVCVAVACMPMLRKSPRDLSEIR